MRKALFAVVVLMAGLTAWGGEFKAGAARRDITPKEPMPMWGYGARHDLPAEGTKLPLYAKALVMDCGGRGRIALVGLDLGRGPTYAMTDKIEPAVKARCGVDYVFAVGSHTHHGPVLELLDEPGLGQGKFDYAVRYAQELPDILIELICEAAANMTPAKIAFAAEETDLNRNRHTKKEPKVRDPRLTVIRVDDMSGKTLAVVANLAAHPVTEDIFDRRWSADWPGYMQKRVEEAVGGSTCLFLQGAAGDMSPNTNDQRRGTEGFGNAAGDKVAEMLKGMEPKVPEKPGLLGVRWNDGGASRLDLSNRLVLGTLRQFFFPELMAMLKEIPDNQVTVRCSAVLINGEIALVGGSGELFSDLSNQIKARSAVKNTMVVGYCNGHCMYIPTTPAVEEGGYGADSTVSWVPVGTGERIVERAVTEIARMAGEAAKGE